MHEITFIIRCWNDLEDETPYPRKQGWRFRLIDPASGRSSLFENPKDLLAAIRHHLKHYSPDHSDITPPARDV